MISSHGLLSDTSELNDTDSLEKINKLKPQLLDELAKSVGLPGILHSFRSKDVLTEHHLQEILAEKVPLHQAEYLLDVLLSRPKSLVQEFIGQPESILSVTDTSTVDTESGRPTYLTSRNHEGLHWFLLLLGIGEIELPDIRY